MNALNAMNDFGRRMVCGLCFTLCVVFMVPSATDAESNIRHRLVLEKNKLEELKGEIDRKEKEIYQVDRKENSILRKLSRIDDRLQVKERELEVLKLNLKMNRKRSSSLGMDIDESRKQLEKQKVILGKRLRVLYKEKSSPLFKVLFATEDFNSLLKRIQYLDRMASYDAKLFNDYRSQLELLKNEKGTLIDTQRKLKELERETLSKKREIASERKEKSQFLKRLKKEKDLTLRARHELKQSSNTLNGLIMNLEKRLEDGQGLSFAESKGYLNPPVSGRFMNQFGRKRDKEYDSYIVYNGVNIKTPKGTAVRAIFNGKTLFTGFLEGYGNLVIVGHGKEYHSLYAHLDEIFTSVGKDVTKGEVLGTSGNTGSLEGDTLYFEMRHKGHPIEPTTWFRTAKK